MTDLVLGLDTATTVSVGLARGSEVLGSAQVTDRMAHVEQLAALVSQVLDEASVRLSDVGLIVVGLGPGPFTGLRVGVATAHVLGFGLQVPLHGVCTLDVIAAQQVRTGTDGLPESDFLVATDARRKEVYWARYGADGQRLTGPEVSSPGALPALPVVGPGADLTVRAHPVSAGGVRDLDPGVLAVVGPGLPDAGRTPLYLRRPDAVEPGRRKSVLSARRMS